MNTLKTDLINLEIGSDDVEISTIENDIYQEYNETYKTTVILPPTSGYRTISYSEVTSPFMLVIKSDKLININLNSNEITNTKFLMVNTSINSLQIANVDVSDAEVKIYIWGQQ